MMRSDLLRFAIVVTLALAVLGDQAPMLILWLAAASLGALDVVFWAAAQRMIPAVADRSSLARANGQLQVVQTLGEQVVGPALGGLLFRATSTLPLIGDGFSFLGSAVLVRKLPKLPSEDVIQTSSYREAVRDAYEWFKRNDRVKAVTLFTTCMAFGQSFVSAVLVVYGTKALGLAVGVGVFLGAIAGGNIIGGLIAERVLERVSQYSLLIVSALVSSVAFAAAAFTSSVYLATIALVVEGIFVQISNTAFAVMRQVEVPRHLLGRVATLTRSLIYGSVSAGALLAGLVAKYSGTLGLQLGLPRQGLGLRVSFFVGAVIMCGGGVVGARPLRRRLRTRV